MQKKKPANTLKNLITHGGYAISLLLGCLLLSQLLFEAVPGEPARRILGPYASQESVERLRQDLGLNRPLGERMARNIFSALYFELGVSVIDGRSVGPEVRQKFARTLALGAQAVAIGVLISIGVLALTKLYPRVGCLKTILRAPSMLPSFLTAILLGIVAAQSFPAGMSTSDPSRIVPAALLPTIVIAVYPASVLVKSLDTKWTSLSRASHYKASRAFGFNRLQLLVRALIAPSASEILALAVGQLSVVLFASLVIEIIFSLPGMGMLILTSIQGNDYPMLQGILIVNALTFVVLHFLSECLYPFLDPRIAQ